MAGLIHLEEIRIGKANESLFLLGEIEKVCHSSVAIYGTGKEACITAWSLQMKYNTSIDAFINVDMSLYGTKRFLGKIIIPLEEAISKNYHIIIALQADKYINEVIWALKIKKYDNFSIAYVEKFHVFQNQEIFDVVCAEMNKILCGEKNILEIVQPTLNVGPSKKLLYDFVELCWTTTWSNHLYYWYYEYFKNRRVDVFEVGPGMGLFSSFMSKVSDANIELMIFDIDDELGRGEDLIDIQYPFDQFVKYYGVIESNNYKIDKLYDIIVLTEVMEHFVTNPIKMIQKFVKQLKFGGYIMLSTPNWGHLNIYSSYEDIGDFSSLDEYKEMYIGHTYQYNYDELIEIFDECGLTVEQYAISDSNNHNFLLKKM